MKIKTGIAFGDHIKTEKIFRRKYTERENYSLRGFFLIFILLVGVGILGFQLLNLQVVKGAYYRNLSDSNRIRTKIIFAPRGILFDRNNTPLVINAPGYRRIVGEKTNLVSRDKALDGIANGDDSILIDSMRSYPYKESFSHVLGYVGQITKEELESDRYAEYLITDWVGKTGLEWQYEPFLKGINGKQLVEVDASGKEIRVLGQTDAVAGNNITLTLDAKLQDAAYRAMENNPKGAVIISNPQGEILTLISKPSFDPNLFTLDESYKASESGYQSAGEIVTDGVNLPLLDRAISGVYPPASTFKIVTSAAGLNTGLIDEKYVVEDTGVVRVGEFSFANWFYTQYGRTDGEVNVVKALARSNDIFYYILAGKIGVDRISETASQMGVGKKLGIDLAGEAAGILPTKKWKISQIGEQWYLGDNYHYGIGQGYLLSTPLQVNAWTSAIGNKGKIYSPHLVKDSKPQLVADSKLTDKTVNLIRQGMIDACRNGGTAYPLFDFAVENSTLKADGKNIIDVKESSGSAKVGMKKITIACKTGTAEHGGEDTAPHAWITLLAPAYDPEIIVTVLAEERGEGSAEAAPVAKKILEEWFKRKR